MNEIDYDKFGFCCLCHRQLVIEEVIDGKVQTRFTPEYIEEEYLLTDGSKMRVAMCIHCKQNHTEEDKDKIMKSVIDGWEKELETLNWDTEKRNKYRDYYYKLKLVTKSFGKPMDILERELKEFKDKKVK